jgi:hypothetical protein
LRCFDRNLPIGKPHHADAESQQSANEQHPPRTKHAEIINRFGISAEPVDFAVAFPIPEAPPSVRHGTIERRLEIGQAAKLNVELTAVRTSELFDTLEAGLEVLASARTGCSFPGQINASSATDSKSHTDFCPF